ncbi:MAG: dienelactone hydrolase family protein [Betaproteobacteria bacterium]|nr:dienelactone hydrolase family protein [Betaproteobacteria bacterium]
MSATLANITFPRPDGQSTRGYLALAGPGKPGVVVIQEWWGLNRQICSIADAYAAAGYNALAPDLYKGRLASNAEEASHLMTGLDFADATHQDLAGALAHLKSRSGKVAVSGYCMGGALTVAACVHLADVTAGVCFYGIPPAAFADPARIRVPFQGHFALRDDWCTPAVVDALEAAMKGAGLSPELHRYEADHAFCNAARPEVYDAACARQAWDRTLAFLSRHLV